MTLYVRTDYVPESCDYLTVGKLYEVTNLRENSKGGDIVADNGITCIIYLGGDSAHIDKAWEQVTLEGEQDNPFTQDSLPIGTVVEWEGKKIEVIPYDTGDCKGCYFYDGGGCSVPEVNCISSDNTDRLERKYILINEQQEEETMSIKLEEEVKQEPEGHVHAELMMEYGKDALVSKTPWRGWQFTYDTGDSDWDTCSKQPVWDETCRYRRKPKTILINGYEVPEPLRVAPAVGSIYWTASALMDVEGIMEDVWEEKKYDIRVLKLGIVHITQEAAELHAKALLSFTTTVQE